jgi:hypothetical protein
VSYLSSTSPRLFGASVVTAGTLVPDDTIGALKRTAVSADKKQQVESLLQGNEYE